MKRLVIFCAILTACQYSSVEESKEQGVDDLKRAIEAIEDRQRAEYEIIEEQERIISVLEQNVEAANSEGMKEKIRGDIYEKRIIIRDAEENLKNQKEILEELGSKLDSLEAVGG